ncbi:MAG: tetratricopeptide repeat protein [Prochloraceae cyanobacterium]|nr:tetratricopeptide repeat protein [Prochloraceae cyanobacterium]
MKSNFQNSNSTQFNQTISKVQRVIFSCTQKLLRNNRDFLSYLERGRAWIQLQEYDKAISDLNFALEIDSKNPQLYYVRGLAYVGIENYIKAISDLSQAIKLEPKNINACRKRGQIYALLQYYELALLDFEVALELNPTCSLCYYDRSLVYYSIGQYKRAKEDFQQVIHLESKDNIPRHSRLSFYSFLSSNFSSKESQDITNEVEKQQRDMENKSNKKFPHQNKYSTNNYYYYLSAFGSALIFTLFNSYINSSLSSNPLDSLQVVNFMELKSNIQESSTR